MAYVQDGLIEAADFNTFQAQIQDVYGVGFGDSGYGQTAITIPTVAGGSVELVKSLEWTALQNAIEVCADHQGTAKALLPPETVLEVGDVITAHDGITDAFDFPQMLSDVSSNRLNVDPGSTSLFLNRHTDTFSSSWNDQAITEFQMTFPTADDARYFFNSGGQIQICLSRSGGTASAQNTSWTDLLNAIGTIILDQTTTTSTGSGSGTSLGYYDLQDGVYQDVFTATVSSGTYAGNNVRVRARVQDVDGTNGDNGRRIRFEVQLNDVFTGAGDLVDGDLEVCVNERRATTHLTINSFVIGVIIPLQGTTVIVPIAIEATSLTQFGGGGQNFSFTNQPTASIAGRHAIILLSIQDESVSNIVDTVTLDPGGLDVPMTAHIEDTLPLGSLQVYSGIFSGPIPDGLTGNTTVGVSLNDGVDECYMSMIVVSGMQTNTPTSSSSGTATINVGQTIVTDDPVDGVNGGIGVGVITTEHPSSSMTWGNLLTKQGEDGSGDTTQSVAFDLLPAGRSSTVETVTSAFGSSIDTVLTVATFR